MNSDSKIASNLKTIYIKNKDEDPEFLADHFGLNWSDLCGILFGDDDTIPSKNEVLQN